ncbi:glycosyltransferase, partial [Aliarcobacter skirrowii]|uniref:glycosyltransferase n=1 Tax=Aliarcobacter skirrowii TaxID=28200 RepID=UPI0029B09B7F
NIVDSLFKSDLNIAYILQNLVNTKSIIFPQLVSMENKIIDKTFNLFWASSYAFKNILNQVDLLQFLLDSSYIEKKILEDKLDNMDLNKIFILTKKGYMLKTYYNELYPYESKTDYSGVVNVYKNKKRSNNKIAIYTANINNYDELILHEYLNENIDYFCVTESNDVNTYGLYNLIKVNNYDIDMTKIARFVKTHPHMFFDNNYDVVIWIDSNIMIKNDIMPLIKSTISSLKPLGAIRHPVRSSIYEEAEECSKLNKDNSLVIERQIEEYKNIKYDNNNLIESNFIIYNMRHPKLKNILNDWWLEIFLKSKRDQLSLNYAIYKNSEDYHRIFDYRQCCRNHDSFAIFAHGGFTNFMHIKPSLPVAIEQPKCFKFENSYHTCDVIICVHNSVKEVKECIDSVISNMDEITNIIIIDDGSDIETKNILEGYSKKNKFVKLFRNEIANGYTKAANRGMKESTSDMCVLLNSDTIVTTNWIPKMKRKLFSNTNFGIIGPLSNAASQQSIPMHIGTSTQTAINGLPKGYDIEDMNNFCENLEFADCIPVTGLVHGFCYAIKKELFSKIGYFDENSFPFGYGEENDFSIRAYKAGYYGVIALDTFVFHHKSKSFKDDERRISLMRNGRENLEKLHGKEMIDKLVKNMQENPYLKNVREKCLELYKD